MASAKRAALVAEDPRDAADGAALVRMLRREAARRRVRVNVLIRPLTQHPSIWLRQLEQAKTPTAETMARVRALLAGEPVPVSSAQLTERKPRPRSVQSLTDHPPMPAQRPLPRVTCFNCGGTSMAPCAHLRRSGWVE